MLLNCTAVLYKHVLLLPEHSCLPIHASTTANVPSSRMFRAISSGHVSNFDKFSPVQLLSYEADISHMSNLLSFFSFLALAASYVLICAVDFRFSRRSTHGLLLTTVYISDGSFLKRTKSTPLTFSSFTTSIKRPSSKSIPVHDFFSSYRTLQITQRCILCARMAVSTPHST